MKTLIVFLSCALLIPLQYSCGGGDSDAPSIGYLDITDATALLLAASSSTDARLSSPWSQSGQDSRRLFKVTEDGYLLEVEYRDDKGKTITDPESPIALFPVGSTHLIVLFNHGSYLVRFSDGAAFLFEDDNGRAIFVSEPSGIFRNSPWVQMGASNDAFFISERQLNDDLNQVPSVAHLSLTTDTNPTVEYVSGETEPISSFGVDGSNYVLATGWRDDDPFRYIYKPSGGFEILPAGDFWRGLEGEMYLWDRSSSAIQRVDHADGEEISYVDYLTELVGDLWFSIENSYRLEFSNRLLVVDSENDRVFEIVNPSNEWREIVHPLSNVGFASSSTQFYYLVGDNQDVDPTLVRMTPETDESTILLTPGLYDVIKMIVSEADVVTFQARRLSDSAYVVGEVTADGTVSILDEDTFNSELTELVQIR